MTKDYIRHSGTVERIEKHKVFVRIEQQAACSACHAKSACMSSDKKEKIIEVYDHSGIYTLNEPVIVSVQSSTGLHAVFLAFVIPLTLVIITLFAGARQSGSEAIGGLIGLSTLIPYYFLLYLFRDKLKRKFIFTLSKAETAITCHPLNTVTH